MDPTLALTGNLTYNIAAEGHRFFDLVYVQDNALRYAFYRVPLRLEQRDFLRGRYRMTVFVSAENAKSITQTVMFTWDGTLPGLTIIPRTPL